MKKTLIAALLAGVLSVVLATGGQVFCAENRAPNAPAPTVFVLLDVVKLQKENPRLRLGLEPLSMFHNPASSTTATASSAAQIRS